MGGGLGGAWGGGGTPGGLVGGGGPGAAIWGGGGGGFQVEQFRVLGGEEGHKLPLPPLALPLTISRQI